MPGSILTLPLLLALAEATSTASATEAAGHFFFAGPKKK
jgi:hypothetical protein